MNLTLTITGGNIGGLLFRGGSGSGSCLNGTWTGDDASRTGGDLLGSDGMGGRGAVVLSSGTVMKMHVSYWIE